MSNNKNMIVFDRSDLINIGFNEIVDGEEKFLKQSNSYITYSFRIFEDGFSYIYNFGTAKRFLKFVEKHKSQEDFRRNFNRLQ